MALIFGLGIVLLSLMAFLTAAAGIPSGVQRMRTSRNPFLLLTCVVVVALVICFSVLNTVLLAKTTFTFGNYDGFHAAVLVESGETKSIDTHLENGNEAKFELVKLHGFLIPHGEYKEYYSDGKPERTLKYYFGVSNGEIAYYYPNGHLAVNGKMFLGVPVDEWKYWYSNGQIAAVGIQSDEASWRIYDASGNPIKSLGDSIGAVSASFLKSGIRFDGDSSFSFDVLQAPVWLQNREGDTTKPVGPFNFPVP